MAAMEMTLSDTNRIRGARRLAILNVSNCLIHTLSCDRPSYSLVDYEQEAHTTYAIPGVPDDIIGNIEGAAFAYNGVA